MRNTKNAMGYSYVYGYLEYSERNGAAPPRFLPAQEIRTSRISKPYLPSVFGQMAPHQALQGLYGQGYIRTLVFRVPADPPS